MGIQDATPGGAPRPRPRRNGKDVPPDKPAFLDGARGYGGRGPIRTRGESIQRHVLLHPGDRPDPPDRRPPLPPRRVPPPVALVRRRGPRTDSRPEGAREEPSDRRRNGPRGAQLRDLRSPGRERDRGILPRPPR